MNAIAENIKTTRQVIGKTAAAFGRKADDICLVAVSKKQPEERIESALAAGQRVFGENRVQEAQERWTVLRPVYSDLKLHLIGPLQSNKAADAVALFDYIQTVDRQKIAKGLAEEMKKQDRSLPCMIQVNTGEEAQKTGISPLDVPDFLQFCRDECGLHITGLMCIPPFDEPAALHFALLKKLAGENGLPELSMGMSSDFEKAIALGATHIRVGTGIFGERV